MNAEASRLVKERKADIDRLGLDAYRQQALKHLKIKTVIKESHCTPVNQLVFNYLEPSLHNLVATVGKDQATVYDDVHMGDFVGVVVHFVNQTTEHAKGGELSACSWVSAARWSPHPEGDACLAVAGTSGEIGIVSVVEARITTLLKGHEKEVVELCSCSGRPGLLASLCPSAREGNVRLWDVPSATLLASFTDRDAASIALHPDGRTLLTGGRNGRVYEYEVPAPRKTDANGKEATSDRQEVASISGRHRETIDCLRFLDAGRLATKSTDGRMFVWDWDNLGAEPKTMKVPKCSPGSRCQFGTTADGHYICAGNSVGEVYVYATNTPDLQPKPVSYVSPVKVIAPVRACGLSDDCRHLLAALGNGFVFRYEFIRPEEKPESPAEPAEGADTAVADGADDASAEAAMKPESSAGGSA